jgi:hypothetical protein
MERIHTYDLKQIPCHRESVDRQGEFEFGLYKCLRHKSENTQIQSTCLVIGYVNESPKKYVVLENAPVGADTGTSSIKLHYVKKDLIERDFEVVDRPCVGILKYPQKGDTVFCLAKDRYQGVSGGESYEVLSMFNERVDVNGSDYTYEPQYFAVITGMPGIGNWPGTKIKKERASGERIIDVSAGMRGEEWPLLNSASSASYHRPTGLGIDYESVSNSFMVEDDSIVSVNNVAGWSVSFRNLIEDDDIRKTELLDEGKLLDRKRPSKKEKKRVIYTPETISRRVTI